jgi:WD40 repeat protein
VGSGHPRARRLTASPRHRLIALCTIALVCGSSALAAATVFRPINGSPFAVGMSPIQVRFGPTGRLLAVSGTRTVHHEVVARWEAALFSFDGTTLRKLPGALEAGPRGVWFGPFAPDGKFVVVYESPNKAPTGIATYAVRQTGLGKKVSEYRFPTGSMPSSGYFSPNGKLLALADLGSGPTAGGATGALALYPAVWIFALGPRGSLRSVPGSPFLIRGQPPMGGNVEAVAFSPDAKLLAISDDAENRVLLYPVSPGGALAPQPVSSHRTGPGPGSLSFSPDGKLLAVADGGAGAVSVFAVGAQGQLTRLPSSPLFSGGLGPTDVAFNPSGKQLAVANESGSVGIFEVLHGERVRRVALLKAPGASSLSYDPSGALLAVAGGSRLAVFSTR